MFSGSLFSSEPLLFYIPLSTFHFPLSTFNFPLCPAIRPYKGAFAAFISSEMRQKHVKKDFWGKKFAYMKYM